MKQILCAALLAASAAVVAQPAATSMRLRGTVEKADANALVVKQRNGEITTLAYADNGVRTMTLRYKDGEKTIRVPEGVPIVTVKPGDRSLLVPGAKVIVTAQMRNGQPTALLAIAGRDGFQPPM